MEMTERQRMLAGVKEKAERKPLDFWGAVGAVIVGNVFFAVVTALLYGVLKVFGG